MNNILVIGDTHIPFEKKGYLEFCIATKKKYKCKTIVHIGDLVDNHAISYHEHDPDGWSPEEEMKVADRHLARWFKAFPRVKLCRGNHDNLVDRKGKTVGLPRRCFNDFREIWKLPKGWEDYFEFEIDGVLYKHGTGYNGKYGHVQAAIDARQSTVIGHLHSAAGVEWLANSKQIMFGMNVGCGIDRKKYAFSYGKDFRRKPILGCGIVTDNGKNAQFIPMEI
jgi:predicted phosphodiesterase